MSLGQVVDLVAHVAELVVPASGYSTYATLATRGKLYLQSLDEKKV